MTAAGIDPKAVKTIVISHFHGDHIFGLITKGSDAPMFPEAEIIVPATELKWWTQPIDSIPQGRRGNAERVQSCRAGLSSARWSSVPTRSDTVFMSPGVPE